MQNLDAGPKAGAYGHCHYIQYAAMVQGCRLAAQTDTDFVEIWSRLLVQQLLFGRVEITASSKVVLVALRACSGNLGAALTEARLPKLCINPCLL